MGLDLVQWTLGQNNPDVVVAIVQDKLEAAIADVLIHEMTADSDYTLLTTGDPPEWTNASIQIVDSGGFLTATRNIIVPDNAKFYFFFNNTLQNLIVKTSAGAGISVPPTQRVLLQCDGTDVIQWTSGESPGNTSEIGVLQDNTQGITTTPTDITNWISGAGNFVTPNASLGTLTVTNAGIYQLSVTVVTDYGANNESLEAYADVNGGGLAYIGGSLTRTGSLGAISMTTLIALNASDVVKSGISVTNNTGNITGASFSLQRVI